MAVLSDNDRFATWAEFMRELSNLRSATGVYHNNITATIPGDWVYQFSASGSVVAVGNGQFTVKRPVL